VSTLAVEFRDKLLMLNKLKPLLGHSSQPQLGQSTAKMHPSAAFPEICAFIETLNTMRKPMMEVINRELNNENILKRRCGELKK